MLRSSADALVFDFGGYTPSSKPRPMAVVLYYNTPFIACALDYFFVLKLFYRPQPLLLHITYELPGSIAQWLR
jgi:hypothetical protein